MEAPTMSKDEKARAKEARIKSILKNMKPPKNKSTKEQKKPKPTKPRTPKTTPTLKKAKKPQHFVHKPGCARGLAEALAVNKQAQILYVSTLTELRKSYVDMITLLDGAISDSLALSSIHGATDAVSV